MSSPFYIAETTQATTFSYSLNDLPGPVDSLTLTGFGSGFMYDGNDDVVSGFILDAEIALTFTINFPGLGPVENTYVFSKILEIDETVEDILNDPEFMAPAIRLILEEEAVEVEDVTLGELFETFTFDSNGIIETAPQPVISYQNDTGPKVGTNERDDIIFSDTGGRLDTLDGDDIVFVDAEEGHVRVTLRRGDDFFWGSDGSYEDGEPAPTTWVNGGVGNDFLVGGFGADTLRGHNDKDVLIGNDGDDRLTGGGDDDQIFGGKQNDKIFGGSGRDILNDGLGNDVLTGGLGRDVFVFDVESNIDFSTFVPGGLNEEDIVVDFNTSVDTLHFWAFGTDISRSDALNIFETHSSQDGDDTVFLYRGGKIIFRDTEVTEFGIDNFYNKPWLIQSEFETLAEMDFDF